MLPLIDSCSDYIKGNICFFFLPECFFLPYVGDLMQVRFGSQFYAKWVGYRIKLVLMSGVLLITASVG